MKLVILIASWLFWELNNITCAKSLKQYLGFEKYLVIFVVAVVGIIIIIIIINYVITNIFTFVYYVNNRFI